MCKKRLVTRKFTLQLQTSRKHNFYPCLAEIQGSKKHSGTRFHPTRLHSWEDKKNSNYTSAEKKNHEFCKYSQNRSRAMCDPLTFHDIRKSKHGRAKRECPLGPNHTKNMWHMMKNQKFSYSSQR